MYLTRAFLNPLSRAVRNDLSDPVSLHRTVMRAFPGHDGPDARKAHGVLHRVDEDPRTGRFVLLLQSTSRPDFSGLPAGYFVDLTSDFDPVPCEGTSNPAVREVGEERQRISKGDRFAFRLRANTTRKITKIDPQTGNPTKNGQRVPVRGDEGRLAWLARHANASGFSVSDVLVTEVGRVSNRPTGRTFEGARFDGHLTVTDAESFRKALKAGLGAGKAFGFGLLSVRPLR